MKDSIIKIKNLFKKKQNFNNAFVIAEIGHNHKGSLKIAKELFYQAKKWSLSSKITEKRQQKALHRQIL